MSWLTLRRYRWDILAFLLLLAVYFFTRLVKLTSLPIFVDEAIYLRWAQIAKNDANWRFISLTDGKQPLYVWATMIVMHFIKDPITAGRTVSTIVGSFSLGAIWTVAYMLFKNRRVAFLSTLFYVVSPFALVYDRMAMMDTTVAFFSLLSMILAVILVRSPRLDTALILGAVLGGGILTKTSGFLSIYLLPLTLLLFNWRNKKRFSDLTRWFFLAGLAVVISQLFYSVLRLSPFFHIISEKNALFVYPFNIWIKDPLYYFWSHLSGLGNWLISYMSWPVLFLVIYALLNCRSFLKEKLLLFGNFLAPFMGLVIMGNILYPRFIFFMCLYLYILAAMALDEMASKIKNRKIWLIILSLVLVYPIWQEAILLTNPQNAKIATSDRDQYILSWPAGYGVKEIITFVRQQAQSQKIFIGTEGTFGMFPYSLELYLWDHPNIEVRGYYPIEEIPAEVMLKANIMPTYMVFNETAEVNFKWPLELVASYPRPNTRYSMKLYRVLPVINEF